MAVPLILAVCQLGNFLLSADFFSKSIFSHNSFKNTFRVSNSLDPDHARHFVRSDLGPNCLQRLSADDTSKLAKSGGSNIFSALLLCHCNTANNVVKPPVFCAYLINPFLTTQDFCCLLSRQLMFLGSLLCKQYGPRWEQSNQGSGFIVFAFMKKSSLKCARINTADINSR